MILVVAILLVLLFTLNNNSASTPTAQPTTAAQSGAASGGASAAPQPATGGQSTAAPAPTTPPAPAVVVVTATQSLTGTGTYMVIDTAKGKITCKLYTDPSAGVTKTVANFVTKANAKYFDGLLFHRVEDWVIQGGDPLSKDPASIANGTAGTGGGTMPAEYNNIAFGVGALGVARGGDPAINNDSQFFIVKDAAQAAGLVGQYTNFGQVVEGMDVVTKIAIGDKINTITIEQR